MADPTSTPTGVVPERLTHRTGIVRTSIVLAGLVLAALVLNVVATLAVSSVLGGDASETLTFAAVTLGTECSFLLVGAAYLRSRSSFRLPVRPPSRQTSRYLVGGLVASFATAFLSLALTDAIVPAFEPLPGYAEYTGLDEVTGIGLAVGAVLSLLVIGPVEEFFFRGVIQGRLREAIDPMVAIGVAGAVFALFHVYPVVLLSPPPGVIAHMAAYYTLMGAIFGWVYHRTDTVVGPVLVHGAFNAVLFATPLLG